MNTITFLGPVGATFSHDAYIALAEAYDAPRIENNTLSPAHKNGEILRMLCAHRGYGAVAMETRAGGRVAEPLESFIDLLKDYDDDTCPITILGATRMKLHFRLMARRNMRLTEIKGIIAHEKAIDACKARIQAAALTAIEASSNGEAARCVAENSEYAAFAALGPGSAAAKYGLIILSDAYEDKEAVTTFHLVGPRTNASRIGAHNRALLVFGLKHEAGALVHALTPFEREGVNLVQIHSFHVGENTYNFAIEVEATQDDLPRLATAIESFKGKVERYIIFGPFEIR